MIGGRRPPHRAPAGADRLKIGRYEVLGTLGQGGMGVVYRARSPSGEVVAIKVLIDVAPEKRARFARERRLLEELGESQGFVPLIDAGEEREPFIVMPFVGGGTLRHRLDRGPLGIEETIRLGRELARALATAHERGIVHRDLKPENILYTDSGRALIADLGLSKHFDPDALGASRSVSMSRSGMWRGTPGYMPSEQMKDAKTAGPSADVFSLGAILYECLAGHPAFYAEDLVAALRKVELGDRLPIGRVRPGVPPALVKVLDRALQPDVARRYPDAQALFLALENASLEAPRSRLGVLLAGGALTAAAVLAGVAVWRLRPEAPRVVAPPPHPSPPPVPAPPVPTPPVVDIAAEADALVKRAALAYRAGDMATAFDLAEKAVATDPRIRGGWYLRGLVKSEKDDDEGAIADLTRAVDLGEPDAKIFAARGRVYARTGARDAAIQDFGRALDLEPDDKFSLHDRGEALFHAERFVEALHDFERCVKLDPTYSDAWFLMGAVHDRLGVFAAAVADMEKVLEHEEPGSRMYKLAKGAILELKKSRSDQLVRLGEAAYAKKDYDTAIKLETEAIELDPTNDAAWLDRGAARNDKGDLDGAIDDATKLIALKPEMPAPYLNRGAARVHKKDFAGGRADYDKAIQLDPKFPEAYMNRGVLERQLNDLPASVADFKKFLELAPDHERAKLCRSEIAYLESRIATAAAKKP